MPSFDFIIGQPFRASLESDYSEIERCFENRAWKSVQILAGSITEALLVDYLSATSNASRPKKDPLKLDLAEAIAICKAEKVLSESTADSCTVIRSYRNLIHPGKIVRLGEEQPSESSAQIAIALIDLIVRDIAKVRRDTFGLTADQVLSKIERDVNCLPILRHLLSEVHSHERDRFFLEVLPTRYLRLDNDLKLSFLNDEEEYGTVVRLKQAYQIAKTVVSEEALTKAAQNYVKMLREGDGTLIARYEDAFFSPSDLKYLPSNQAILIKQHLLAKLKRLGGTILLDNIRGIEGFLESAEVGNWLDPFVRTLISSTVEEKTKTNIYHYLNESVHSTSGEVDAAIWKRLDAWADLFQKRAQKEDLAVIEKLRAAMEPDLPF